MVEILLLSHNEIVSPLFDNSYSVSRVGLVGSVGLGLVFRVRFSLIILVS